MGHWEELHPEVWETVVTPCDSCGQVVPKRIWRAEVEGRELRFCSERARSCTASTCCRRSGAPPQAE